MFEKIGRLAERAANEVGLSRRGFLGRVGQAALSAAALGSLLVLPRAARAGGAVVCCRYKCVKDAYCRGGGFSVCLPAGSTCTPYSPYGMCICRLVSQTGKSACSC
jgi:hypothetical protein